MKATINIQEMVAQGRKLEQAGELSDAARIYQRAVDDNGTNQEAVGRLLVVYRKLKEYGKELAVIDGALAAYKQQDKALQEKWLKEHPNAAGAGKAIFRKLGGAGMSGADSVVEGLLKRKGFLERRLAGGKMKKRTSVRHMGAKRAGGRSKQAAMPETKNAEVTTAKVTRKEEERNRKAAVATQRQKADAARKAEAAEKKLMVVQERRAAAAVARKRMIEERRLQMEARQAKKMAAKEAKSNFPPSLFVVTLRYLASLEKIEAAMPRQKRFLDKHFRQGDFLVYGIQIPQTGVIIIARGKNRAAVERMMKQDPFVKEKLASSDIVEFSASQVRKELEKWVKPPKKNDGVFS